MSHPNNTLTPETIEWLMFFYWTEKKAPINNYDDDDEYEWHAKIVESIRYGDYIQTMEKPYTRSYTDLQHNTYKFVNMLASQAGRGLGHWDEWDSPYKILSEKVIHELIDDICYAIPYIERLGEYICFGNHFYKTYDERQEIDARAIIYKACSKAYWDPHCEIGRRLADKRIEELY